jgi:dienelactone hydrolase
MAAFVSGTAMLKPCCKGVVRDEAGLTGKAIQIGALNTYAVGDPAAAKGGVIVVYDIYGGGIPNCKFVADHLAAHGYYAIMPDFYGSQGLQAWEEKSALGSPEFGAWFGTVVSPEYWAKYNTDVEACVAYLKQKGCQKVATVGFCHGGWASCGVSAATGVVDAAVSHHGAGHVAEHVKTAKCPQLFTSVEGDNFFDADAHAAVRAEMAAQQEEGSGKQHFGSELVVYGDGAYHGFVVRGDFANNAKVKEQSDDAMARTVAFLDKHIKKA